MPAWPGNPPATARTRSGAHGIARFGGTLGRRTETAWVGFRLTSPSSTAARKIEETVRITWVLEPGPSFMPAIHCWVRLGRFPRSRHFR